MTDCEHIFDNSESICTVCLKPAWQIAQDTGMDELETLQEQINKIAKNFDELTKCVLAIAKGLPPKK